MRIHPVLYGFLVLGLFLGTILGFQSAGVWSVSGKITNSGEQVQPDAADVNTIKGWMTLEQISTTYAVPLVELLNQFGLPGDTPASTAIKDLETDLFSVTNLRLWLQERSLPVGIGESSTPQVTSTPTALVEPQLTSTTDISLKSPSPSLIQSATPTTDSAIVNTVTGKSTFQDLLDWGVSKEAIEKVLDGTIPDPSMLIKDYLNQQGIEFASIKTALQAEVDQVK